MRISPAFRNNGSATQEYWMSRIRSDNLELLWVSAEYETAAWYFYVWRQQLHYMNDAHSLDSTISGRVCP